MPGSDQPPPPATTLVTGEHGPLVLASDADRLYWGTTEKGTGAVIRAMPKNGGSAETLFSLPRQLDVPGGLHHTAWIDALYVDANWVFFSTMEVESVPNPDDVATPYQLSAFYRAPKTGGSAEPFTGPQGFGLLASLFSSEEDFVYSVQAMSPTGIVLAAVPKAGGMSSAIRLPASVFTPSSSRMAVKFHAYLGHGTWSSSTLAAAGAGCSTARSRRSRAIHPASSSSQRRSTSLTAARSCGWSARKYPSVPRTTTLIGRAGGLH